MLQAHSFQVARYGSLERLVDQSKKDYYGILDECSQGWREGKNDLIPWWNYFLSVLRLAYKQFERQVESTGTRPSKSDLVRQTVFVQMEQFTLGDLAANCRQPASSLSRRFSRSLKKQGEIRLDGRGRGARWGIIPQKARQG